MGVRDDARDDAQDCDAAGERQPWSRGPSQASGLAQALDPAPAAGPEQAPEPEGTWDGPTEASDPAELPDLLDLDLAELRTVQHPVLAEVLADLRERSGQPSEILWGFNNAF
ncbi:FxSxx-COOH cyclophane-containing RiPP peptide [Streptomyces sp. NPDC005251]|uniref:FxSxx-COOH cyclophane-containing RiPP peptide n=1 Tax=unclassified Streptomyces TaxID=2593676 RepID=UPI0033AF59FF